VLLEAVSVRRAVEALEKASTPVQVSVPKALALPLWLPAASPGRAIDTAHLAGK